MSDSSRTHATSIGKPALLRASAPQARAGGPLHTLRESLGNRAFGMFVQTQLIVGGSNDVYEREADRVADDLMRMDHPDGTVPAISTIAPQSIQRQPDEFEEPSTGDGITGLAAEVMGGADGEPEALLQAKHQIATGPSLAGTTTASEVRSMQGHGQPLSPGVRDYFEPRFGRDFSTVRTHTDHTADRAATTLGARAFAFGDHIAFRRGDFAPETCEGRQLLAHELSHVVQQSGSGLPLLQRAPYKAASQPGTAGSRFFTVHVDTVLTSDDLLIEFIKQYHKVNSDAEARLLQRVNKWHWLGAPIAAGPADAQRGYVIIPVHLDKGGAVPEQAKETGKTLAGLPPEDQARIAAEVDRQFTEQRGAPARTAQGNGPRDAAAEDYRQQIEAELVEQRAALDALSPALRAFLFDKNAPVLAPRDYARALRLATKLGDLSPADLEDYRSRVTREGVDWDSFESSIERYRIAREARRKETIERESIKRELNSLEDVYAQYIKWKSLRSSAGSIPAADESGVYDDNSQRARDERDTAEAELIHALKLHQISSIAAFETMIDNYLLAFRKETVAVAMDTLARAEHGLFEAEKLYRDPQKLNDLYQKVAQSGARETYAAADKTDQEAIAVPIDPELHRALPHEREEKSKLFSKAQAQRSNADAAVAKAAEGNPVLQDREAPRRELADAGRDDFQRVLLEFIARKRDDIRDTRNNIIDDNTIVFDLPPLLETSRKAQGVAKGSIFDEIVINHVNDKHASKMVLEVALGVLALALGLVSAGTGTVAVLAAFGAFSISAFQAIEAYDDYLVQSAAYGANVGDDKPSPAWVILAVVGAGIDLGGAGKTLQGALKALRPAAEALETGGGILQVEKALANVDDKLRLSALRAAKEELAYRTAVRGFVESTARLNAILIPAEQVGKLVAVSYRLARRGIFAFEKFLLELKAQKLISRIDKLPPEDLIVLKRAAAEGIEKSKTGFVRYADIPEHVREVLSPEEVESLAEYGKLLGLDDVELKNIFVGRIRGIEEIEDPVGFARRLEENMRATAQRKALEAKSVTRKSPALVHHEGAPRSAYEGGPPAHEEPPAGGQDPQTAGHEPDMGGRDPDPDGPSAGEPKKSEPAASASDHEAVSEPDGTSAHEQSGAQAPASARTTAVGPSTAKAQQVRTDAETAFATAKLANDEARKALIDAEHYVNKAKKLSIKRGERAVRDDLVKEAKVQVALTELRRKAARASRSLAQARTELEKARKAVERIEEIEARLAVNEKNLALELNPPGGFEADPRLPTRHAGQRPLPSDPRGAKYRDLEKKIKDDKALLRGEDEGLTLDISKQIRDANPGPEKRPMARQNAQRFEGLRTNDANPIDVTTGQPMTSGDWAVDHIVSRSELARDARFRTLSPAQRHELLLEFPENFMPLTRSANSQKHGRTVAEWIEFRRGQEQTFKPEIRQALVDADVAAREAIKQFYIRALRE